MKRAIVYVNSRHFDLRYIREAEVSAGSFKDFMPDSDYLLFTDAPDFESDIFTHVIPCTFSVPETLKDRLHFNGQMLAKLRALAELDWYEQVIYLGSDTYAISQEAGSLFDLLDRFDIAAAHAKYRINVSHGNSALPQIPVCFPEFNCDLIVYRNTGKVRDFLKDWGEKYASDFLGHPHDQGVFRWLAYHSDLRIATLPPEYNYRDDVFRTDTVILQNRAKLAKYLKWSRSNPRSVGRINSLLRRAKLPFMIAMR